MKENIKKTLLYIVIPIILIGSVLMAKTFTKKSEEKKYYQIVQMFYNNEVSEYTLNLYSGELKYKLRDNDNAVYRYSVPNVSLFESDIHESVIKNNIEKDVIRNRSYAHPSFLF